MSVSDKCVWCMYIYITNNMCMCIRRNRSVCTVYSAHSVFCEHACGYDSCIVWMYGREYSSTSIAQTHTIMYHRHIGRYVSLQEYEFNCIYIYMCVSGQTFLVNTDTRTMPLSACHTYKCMSRLRILACMYVLWMSKHMLTYMCLLYAMMQYIYMNMNVHSLMNVISIF